MRSVLDLLPVTWTFPDVGREPESSAARLSVLVDAGRLSPRGSFDVVYDRAHLAHPALRSLLLAGGCA